MKTYTPKCVNERKPKNSDIETRVCKCLTIFGAAKSVGIKLINFDLSMLELKPSLNVKCTVCTCML